MADVLKDLSKFIDGEEKDFASPELEERFNDDIMLYDYEEEDEEYEEYEEDDEDFEEYEEPFIKYVGCLD